MIILHVFFHFEYEENRSCDVKNCTVKNNIKNASILALRPTEKDVSLSQSKNIIML